ncbi:MAG TPA: hypothetical protein VHU40_06725 [Polyangia bacterium]|nr:hypothetical protein [Polyangia bacterium]
MSKKKIMGGSRFKWWVMATAIVAVGAGTQAEVAARGKGGIVDKGTCSFRGKKLYGKIQIVSDHADVTVQEVGAFPDLKMKQVPAFPDRCGLWQLVESGADTKIQFVSAFPDVRIQRVAAFAGLP